MKGDDAESPGRTPKYLRLARGFERQMQTGVLRIGDRLPSVRQLRDEHNVSVATAVGCYVWLERQGYVRARPRSGFYVSRAPQPDGPAPGIAERPKGPVRVRVGHGTDPEAPLPRRMIPLGSAVVGPALLPMGRLNRSTRLALAAFADNAVRYEDPQGSLRLRRQIARLAFRQGTQTTPDDVVVTNGATEAFNLSLRAVARAGDVVAVESPGCYELLQSLETLQMRAVEIPHVPGRGISLEWLEGVVARHPIKAVLLGATCHNPLGDLVKDEHKAALVAFATRTSLPLIEGDAFGDLVFTGARPRPLKAFDETGIVLHCASLAHYVAPGFNIGWILAGRWHETVRRLKAATSVSLARLPQLAMAEFLESGAFERHVRRLRPALWQCVEASRQEILRTFPEGTRVSRPEGGFVLWIQLPKRFDGAEVRRQAAEAGVEILPGEIFSPTRLYRHCIRIACGHPFDVVRPALKTLAALLA